MISPERLPVGRECSTITTSLVVTYLHILGAPRNLLLIIFVSTVGSAAFVTVLIAVLFVQNYKNSGVKIDETYIYPYGVSAKLIRVPKVEIRKVEQVQLWSGRGHVISARLKGEFGTLTIDLEEDQINDIVETVKKSNPNVHMSEHTLCMWL